jgi:Cytochrome c biogenesis factor
MSWTDFIWFAAAAELFWATGAVLSISKKRNVWIPAAVSAIGSKIFLTFIILMWIGMGRPPMRTMGETRLWFSLFLSVIGIGIFIRWKHRWILPFSTMMATVFVCINLLKPEIHSSALMPALQSPWFVPHVIVYMFAYATMGAATILGGWIWWKSRREDIDSEHLSLMDSLVRMGWGFLTLGITMGALWAKEAWGDFWAWDPKEVWAAATWISYLMYMHIRLLGSGRKERDSRKDLKLALCILFISFLLLQMCWWGVNFLPSAKGFSLHTY